MNLNGQSLKWNGRLPICPYPGCASETGKTAVAIDTIINQKWFDDADEKKKNFIVFTLILDKDGQPSHN